MADFNKSAWWTAGATLNMNTQLVGQPTQGNPWGTPDANSGDFNIFTSSNAPPNAPDGCFFFTLCGPNYEKSGIVLTSFAPMNAVPEPGSLPLLATGLAMLSAFGLWRRRRKKTSA